MKHILQTLTLRHLSLNARMTGLVGIMLAVILGIVSATLWVTSSQQADGVIINLAGRQRMLTQKITKATMACVWTQQGSHDSVDDGQRQTSDSHREEAISASRLFDETLVALLDGGRAKLGDAELTLPPCGDESIRRQLLVVAGLWESFKLNVDAVLQEQSANPESIRSALDAILADNQPLLAEMNKAVGMFQAASDRRVATLIKVQYVAGLAGLIVFGAVVFYIRQKICRPIKDALGVAQAVIVGDLSQRCQVTANDEVGKLLRTLNRAVEAVAHSMSEVKDSAEREQQLQAEKAEQERRQAEAEQRRQTEEASRERQRMEEERQQAEQQAEQERRQAETDRQNAEILRRKVDNLLEVVDAAAEGDLTRTVEVEGDEPVDELAAGIGRMIRDLSGIIGEVRESAIQFGEGSRVIAESSQTLADGAQHQAASVEEMSASIDELNRAIEAVQQNATEADRVANATNNLAEEGGAAVQKSTEAMELIRSSSNQIGEIIQVISEIASQTNLLALNAAIEAARAGEHGMGFAVVADEVRKLAERSNQAAGEITALIRESTDRVAEGAQLSASTGESLTKIIEGVQGTAAKISEIAAATVEQATNAREVAGAIQGVSEVAEQSAAGSEELASSSEQLGAQAATLGDLVTRFQTESLNESFDTDAPDGTSLQ